MRTNRSLWNRPVFAMLLALLLALGSATSVIAQPNRMPAGFVYLADVAPSITQDMRYHSAFNFIGAPVDGYQAPVCILTRRAAQAVARVQTKAEQRGLSLKVHDCYRPARAVAHFVRWSQTDNNPSDRWAQQAQARFYPREQKTKLFSRGYIARRSGHSRGSTVDLTLIAADALPPIVLNLAEEKRALPCHANPVHSDEVGAMDMGTRFDCLDVLSTTDSSAVPRTAQINRALLKRLMADEGFRNYSKEWWHYTLREEPFPNSYFDFPVH